VVPGSQLQDIGQDDGISPWVARIAELDRVAEITVEWWHLAVDYQMLVVAIYFHHGWWGL